MYIYFCFEKIVPLRPVESYLNIQEIYCSIVEVFQVTAVSIFIICSFLVQKLNKIMKSR